MHGMNASAILAIGPLGAPELMILGLLFLMLIGSVIAVAVVVWVVVRKRSNPTPPPLPPSQPPAPPA